MELYWLDSVIVETPEAFSREVTAEAFSSKSPFVTEDVVG